MSGNLAPGASPVYLEVPAFETIEIPRKGPGWHLDAAEDVLFFVCKCARLARLKNTHQIDDDGKVSPGVKCVFCGFEKHIMLIAHKPNFKPLQFCLHDN